MTDPQIRQLVRSEIHKSSQTGRFNVQNQGRHTHNDIDSPYVFQPILSYVGLINSDGTIALLPVGWTVDYTAPSEYVINHNLGTLLYSVTFTSNNLNVLVAPSMFNDVNNFVVVWNKTSNSAGQASSFNFTLTTINNKTQKLPKYYGTLT